MSKCKYTYEFVKSVFESRGYELLSKEYKNTHTKMQFICPKHGVQSIPFHSIYNLKCGCIVCGYEKLNNKTKLPYETVKHIFESVGLELLSDTYINVNSPLECRCALHKDIIQYISCAYIKKNKYGCRICEENKIKINTRKTKYEVAKNEFKNMGYELLDTEYINNHYKMKCICLKHPDKIQYKTLHSIRDGDGCKLCGIERRVELRRHGYDYVEKEFLKKGFKLLEKKYINSSQKLSYICLKHPEEIQYTTYYSLKANKHICKNCLYEARSRENNWNWNPNITDEERIKQRAYEEYYEWRKSVYDRDGYICQCCGYSQGGVLNAHHLYNYADYEELRVDIDNGVTLCESCHIRFHSMYGSRNTTKEQFQKFVNDSNYVELEAVSVG